MAGNLVVVAKIEAKQDNVDFVKAELIKLLEPTRKEAGCLQYHLHQDNSDPAVFLFYEIWESRELLQAHMESEHFKCFVEATKDALAGLAINEMSRV